MAQHRKERRIVGLSVAIARNDDIIFAEGFGWQDYDGEEPATARTTYLVASITKTFTAATLFAMAEDNKINLDADFTTLSDWAQRCQWLTTSGVIFGGATLDDGTVIAPMHCDRSFTLRQVLSHRVNGQPGRSFLYNPVVFGRLSNWVEENTDRSWRDWMNAYVLDPGGLSSLAAGWRDPRKSIALTYLAPPFKNDASDNNRPRPSPMPNTELNASSGVIASVLDLAAYSIALDKGRILSPSIREKMWSPPNDDNGQPAPYAYGWYVQRYRGHRLIWHAGWWPDAYTGLLLKLPDAGWTLVALANTEALRWGNPLDKAQVENSPVARKFLELFVEDK